MLQMLHECTAGVAVGIQFLFQCTQVKSEEGTGAHYEHGHGGGVSPLADDRAHDEHRVNSHQVDAVLLGQLPCRLLC